MAVGMLIKKFRSVILLFFFFKQKTAYEIYQCDWSSDVCSSDLKRRSVRGRIGVGKVWGRDGAGKRPIAAARESTAASACLEFRTS